MSLPTMRIKAAEHLSCGQLGMEMGTLWRWFSKRRMSLLTLPIYMVGHLSWAPREGGGEIVEMLLGRGMCSYHH